MIVQVTRRLRKKRIVILGGGFGGVYAASHREKLLARQCAVEISLVSRDNFFCSHRCFTRSPRAISRSQIS
jgi:NADH dehydrogenase FAD-containing subunit